MDTELTVVVVLVVLAAIAGAALLVVQGRRYRQEQRRLEAVISDQPVQTDDLPLGADRPGGGWHGPSCSGGFPAVDPARPEPVVPAQRTGDHDRRATVRPLTARLLRRHG
jgi:type II secretory pathway pseudopilin PulG